MFARLVITGARILQRISLGYGRAKSSTQFDHLVGESEQSRRYGQAEYLRRLEVNDQLEFGRLYDRQVSRFGAVENAAQINPCLSRHFGKNRTVSDQPPEAANSRLKHIAGTA